MYHHFINVFKREVLRIYKHPSHLILLTLAVIFSYVFFLTLMGEGQPEKLPIGIVDEDGSYVSQRLCHEIEAMQGVHIKQVYDSHAEARDAMQRHEIFAFLEIPSGTYREVLEFRSPHISLYANQIYLLSGSLSYRSLMTICNMASGAVQREVMRKKGYSEDAIMGLIMPVELDTHQIGNPMANYECYLLTTILPGILGLMVIMLTVYVVGVELKKKTSKEWMAMAGGDIFIALGGKLLPYTFWFLFLQEVGNVVLFGGMHFPLNGSFGTLFLASLLFVIAMQASGIFLIGLIPIMRDAICLAAFWGIWGFSLSGFTYPVSAMDPPLHTICLLFPLRHYYMIYVNEAIFGGGFAQSAPYLVGLLCFIILPFTVLMRLRSALVLQNYPLK
jgi:ABC-2 type transport system permease protein